MATLSTLVEQIKILDKQIGEQLAAHADAHIFTSLPRSGTVRAAAVAEIGDCLPDSPPRSTDVPGRRDTLDKAVRKNVPIGFR